MTGLSARCAWVALLVVSPAVAQQRDNRAQNTYNVEDQPPTASASAPVTRTADTGTGQIGQRQTRREAAPNAAPLDRIASRVSNRVQNRIRNRIDRYYDPQANAISPFAVAGDQARTAGTRPR